MSDHVLDEKGHALQLDIGNGPLSRLTEEQRARVAALNMAKPLITTKGALGSGTAPDVADLIRLAVWILDGSEEPLYPFVSGDVVILGPEIFADVNTGLVCWKGTNYTPQEVDDE